MSYVRKKKHGPNEQILLESGDTHSIFDLVMPRPTPPPSKAGCFCGGGKPVRRVAVLAAEWVEYIYTASRPLAEEHKKKKSQETMKVLKK